jgi:hypothetical protein
MGMLKHVPPHTFDALTASTSSGTCPATSCTTSSPAAPTSPRAAADSANHQHFADIVIFIHQFADKLHRDDDMFNFKWETWRSRFSPDATEISFSGDTDD